MRSIPFFTPALFGMVLIVSAALAGCDGGGSSSSGSSGGQGSRIETNAFGKIDGDRYTNSHFAFAFETPAGWHRASDEFLAQAIELGDALVSEDLAKIAEATRQNHAIVFFVSEHEMGTPVAFNGNINFVVERVTHLPGIKTTDDYIAGLRQVVANEPSIQLKPGTRSLELGGETWRCVDQVINAAGVTVLQTQAIRYVDGYVVVATVSADTPEKLEAGVAKLAELRALPE